MTGNKARKPPIVPINSTVNGVTRREFKYHAVLAALRLPQDAQIEIDGRPFRDGSALVSTAGERCAE